MEDQENNFLQKNIRCCSAFDSELQITSNFTMIKLLNFPPPKKNSNSFLNVIYYVVKKENKTKPY